MLSALLPVLDEEGNIPRFKTELIPVLNELEIPWEIVIVNDGSTDKSRELLSDIESKYSNVRVIQHETTKGLGGALRTGILECKGDLIVTLDADFTFHPKYIPALLAKYREESADCVIGSPFMEGAELQAIPAYRSFLTHVSNGLYRNILHMPVTSITGIFRLYRAQVVKGLQLKSDGFSINAEILAHLVRNKSKIVEIPVPLTGRIAGSSKAKIFRETFRHLRLMFKLLLGWF